jgi:hypothetical protein
MSLLPDDIEDMVKPTGESGIKLRSPSLEEAKRVQVLIAATDHFPSVESIVNKINAASLNASTEMKP